MTKAYARLRFTRTEKIEDKFDILSEIKIELYQGGSNSDMRD